MPKRNIIVIGGSAGGVEAMLTLARDLPANLDAAIGLVIHLPSESAQALPHLLTRNGALPAAAAIDGEPLRRGQICVAPPDHHLLFHADGHVRVVRGPRENRHRPAVDPLFRSAAVAYGPQVIGVVLSGNLDDGTLGLRAIKHCGGTAVVQDPNDALFASMPASALEHVKADHCLPVSEMGRLLARRVDEPVAARGPAPADLVLEARMAENQMTTMDTEQRLGQPSFLSCPECGGTLWELDDEEMLRFRCHLGHAYTADNLMAGQGESVEHALWVALRALRERAEMMRRLASRMRERGQERVARRFDGHREEAQRHAGVIQTVLATNGNEAPVSDDGPDSSEAAQ